MSVVDLEDEHPEIYRGGPTEEMYARWDALWSGRRMPWTGEYPGSEQCRELGFWCVFDEDTDGVGGRWRRVPAGYPGASEDLNRLVTSCDWDPGAQRWVPR